MKRMKNERSFKDRRKKGVSPVIGVILMVAATIVIAAVVLAMLGGFTAPGKTYSISATAEIRYVGTTATAFVTYMGGPDADQVDCITGTVTDTATGTPTALAPQTATDWGTCGDGVMNVVLGSVATEGTGAYTVGGVDDHIVVIGTFLDGSTQVILDDWM
jgi:flagellin-like protein